MGIEMALLMGAMTALKANSELKQAENQAEGVVAQANLDAKNKAEETRQRAARAKVSFLNSGVTLEGTASSAISGMFASGLADVNLISSNANTQSKNIMSQARTKAITDIGMSVATMGMNYGGAAGGSQTALGSTTFGTNSFGGFKQAYASGFDSTAMGPFQDPFKFGGN